MKTKEEQRLYAKAWRTANRDRVQAYARARHAAHPEKNSAYSREWRLRHPGESRARAKAHYDKAPEPHNSRMAIWRTKNPDYARLWFMQNPNSKKAHRHKRRAAEASTGGYFTAHEWFTLCFAVGFKCLCCKKLKPLVPDHVIPISKGGPSWLWNIQPLCHSCNSVKHTKNTDYREDITI